MEAETISAKHIFLDIEGFTYNRSVEAQTEIVSALNDIVRQVLSSLQLTDDQVIFLPTGDGMCIVLLGVDKPYDIHLRVALQILEQLERHNASTQNSMRQFAIRIGVNANIDNLVTDINGKRNIAGAGINMAQRVMSSGDGNQLMVGAQVFDTLRHREPYMVAFREYVTTIKHGTSLTVYQYIGSGHPGLNLSEPSNFAVSTPGVKKLPQQIAAYCAIISSERNWLSKQIGHGAVSYALVCLMWHMAIDFIGTINATDVNPYQPRTWGAGKNSLDEQLAYYKGQDFWLLANLKAAIERDLSPWFECFEMNSDISFRFLFLSELGLQRLRQEQPEIAQAFELAPSKLAVRKKRASKSAARK